MGSLLLINGQADISDERIDFLLFASRITSLEVVEDVEMLAWGKQVEQDIVLGTDAHELTHLLHLLEEVCVVTGSLTSTLLDESSEHGDRCRFTSTVVAQESENLRIVHFHVDSPNCSESTSEGLLKVRDAEVVTRGLKSAANGRGCFIIVGRHLTSFEIVII